MSYQNLQIKDKERICSIADLRAYLIDDRDVDVFTFFLFDAVFESLSSGGLSFPNVSRAVSRVKFCLFVRPLETVIHCFLNIFYHFKTCSFPAFFS